jgi:selenide,water dikinase
MNSSQNRLIEKSVVLVGAGNAHLVFLRRLGMRPIPGVAVTLVNEFPEVPYSAMVPAYLAGALGRDDLTIDLVRLCQAVGVRFVIGRALGVDRSARRLRVADRLPLSYDVLSLGLGSLPLCPAESPAAATLPLRPLGTLMRRLEELEQDLKSSPRPFHLAVVGGGASGCELALAIHSRFASHAGFRLTLLQREQRLLPSFPSRAARIFTQAFQERSITCRLNAHVRGYRDGALLLDGEGVPVDAVLWATSAGPPGLLGESGLALDAAGFLRVADTLQSLTDPCIFGTGDCVTLASHPGLARNGVHAVRQGRVLFDNVEAFLKERALRPFRPQRFCLCLLNTSDGRAVFTYGPLTWQGRWPRRLKDRIDRSWVASFRRAGPVMVNGSADGPLMRCGGCGSKIAGDVLSAVLKRLEVPDDPRVLFGCRAAEDAAVHWVRPAAFSTEPEKLVEVQTVDYFKAFVSDPYLFGRIAALHALSDLYAMNARPFVALAIATLPEARGPIQESQLYELLGGALRSLKELGVVLTGGHTTEGPDLALGFAVTGFGEEGRLFLKSQLRPGDRLILTKPLGTGALLAAWMRQACRAAWWRPLTETMLVPNANAAAVFQTAGVLACTDITGFGLAGHLLEMLDASHVSARLSANAVPLLPGFEQVVAQGIVSSLHADNARTACRIRGSSKAWLFDPQTSGGLLGAVRPELLERTLEQLCQAGCGSAAAIGEILPLEEKTQPEIILE